MTISRGPIELFNVPNTNGYYAFSINKIMQIYWSIKLAEIIIVTKVTEADYYR